MSLKVNGKAYGWGDVDIKLPRPDAGGAGGQL